jgi:hypothetical protein
MCASGSSPSLELRAAGDFQRSRAFELDGQHLHSFWKMIYSALRALTREARQYKDRSFVISKDL